MEREFFINTGLRNLYCFAQFPKEFKNGDNIAILLHGILVDCRAYPLDDIANYLLSKGFACIRFDFNGHGRSDGEFVDMTVPREIEDACFVFKRVKKVFDKSRILVLGHSQGGTVASMACGLSNELIDGLILMAPGAVLEDACNEGHVVDAVFDPDNIPDRLFAMKNVFGGEYFRTGRVLHVYQVSAGFKGPVLILHGSCDSLVPVKYSMKYGEIYRKCKIYVIEGSDHWFYKGLGLCLNHIENFINQEFSQK